MSNHQQDAAVINARQLVAFNIRKLRRQRGWDQPATCRRLTDSGLDWSPTKLSAAEATWAGKSGRQRHFTAAELLALAKTFEVPISQLFWFPDEAPTGDQTSQVQLAVQVGDDASAVRLTREEMTVLADEPDRRPDLQDGTTLFEIKTSKSRSTDQELRSALVFLRDHIESFLTEGGEDHTKKENQ